MKLPKNIMIICYYCFNILSKCFLQAKNAQLYPEGSQPLLSFLTWKLVYSFHQNINTRQEHVIPFCKPKNTRALHIMKKWFCLFQIFEVLCILLSFWVMKFPAILMIASCISFPQKSLTPDQATKISGINLLWPLIARKCPTEGSCSYSEWQ